MDKSQKEYIYDYFVAHPDRDITTDELVNAVVPFYERKTGKRLKDPDRAIRTLYDEGKLIKAATGLYRYDSKHIDTKETLYSPPPPEIIAAAKARDGYKCVVCCRGEAEGERIMVDQS